jgi:hypothetical protein
VNKVVFSLHCTMLLGHFPETGSANHRIYSGRAEKAHPKSESKWNRFAGCLV